MQKQRFGVWDIYPVTNNKGEEVSLWIARNEVHVKRNCQAISFAEKGRIKTWSLAFFLEKLGLLEDQWLITAGTSTIPELPDGLIRSEFGHRSIVAHRTEETMIHVKVDQQGNSRIHSQNPGEKREKIALAPAETQRLASSAETLARSMFKRIQEICAEHRVTVTFVRFSFARRLSDNKLVPIGGVCDPDLAGFEYKTNKCGETPPQTVRLGRDEMKRIQEAKTVLLCDRIRDKWRTFQTVLTTDFST
ncbi:MAG: hypothetical protein K8Q97_01425 [Candidatus Andersenbacteria bacterium]|nr:hypothetical protein [Candidatus Andersenbacteria bacterium]